jgi:hypothetical protein
MPKHIGGPPVVGRYDWEAIKRRLHQKPDEWVLVPALKQVNRGLAAAIRRGDMSAMRPTDEWAYSAVSRNTNGTKADIYLMATKSGQEKA